MSLTRAIVGLFSLALLAAPVASAKTKKDYRVTCGDGTTARPGKGACSHHGGIKADGKSGMLCTDGTVSDSMGPDACSGHKGVARKGQVAGKDDPINKAHRETTKDEQIARDERERKDKPAKDIVTCKDGTTASGRLGCFGHGGAAKSDYSSNKVNREDVKRDTTTGSGGDEPGGVAMNPTGATARCKDGKFSHAKNHSGACSRHGGVAEWLDKK